jgi:hypothetical protein
MKFFMLGSVCGGIAVSFVSAVLLHDADAAFWQLCIGYAGFACITGAIYGAALRVMAFALHRVTQDDAWRGLATGAITTAAQYAAITFIGNHESDRTILIVAPLCAAAVDAFRARRSRPGFGVTDEYLTAEPPVIKTAPIIPGTDKDTE